jgi:hypothetical protein
MLYEAVTFLQLLPLSGLLIISCSCGTVKIMCYLLPALPCLLICGSSEAAVVDLIKHNMCSYNTIKIEFGLHHTSGMTCQLLVIPPGCGTIPTYGNLKSPAWRGSLS